MTSISTQPTDPNTKSNLHQFRSPTDTLIGITEKRKKFLTCTHEITIRAKLE
jgi:hypothetical protein